MFARVAARRVGAVTDREDGPIDPMPLRAGLERFLRHLGAPPAAVLTELGDRWHEIVGPVLSTSTSPAEVVDGVLVVLCDDPAWASQISWMQGQILRRVAEEFDGLELDRVATRIRR